jgi:hypothetical protein
LFLRWEQQFRFATIISQCKSPAPRGGRGFFEQKEPDLSRPEAIRRLVELGLKVKK